MIGLIAAPILLAFFLYFIIHSVATVRSNKQAERDSKKRGWEFYFSEIANIRNTLWSSWWGKAYLLMIYAGAAWFALIVGYSTAMASLVELGLASP